MDPSRVPGALGNLWAGPVSVRGAVRTSTPASQDVSATELATMKAG